MKQKLIKTVALGLMALVGVNAWADRDPDKAIYCPVNDGSYDNIKEAYDAIKGNAATELEIQIWNNRPLLGAVANSRIDAIAGKTLSIVPKVSGIILKAGSHNRGNIWFLNGQDNATLNIGSSEYAMAIEGYGFNDNNRQFSAVCANEKKGVMNITNVTFQKFRFGVDGTKYGYVYANKVAATSSTGGYVTMTDVTINNCETDNAAFINSINTNNDAICLKGNFTINHREGKSEPVFSLKGRIKLGDKSSNSVYNDFSAPNLITIVWGGATTIGTNVIVKVPAKQATGIFDIADESYGLVRSGSGGDMKLTQAYNLAVTAAGAATLVLPFESTIPSGVEAYTLTHTSGASTVNAEAVETTLPANTPVLINAEEGTYKFVSTATSGDPATGSDPVTVGALTGVYADQTFGTDIAVDNHYILNKVDENVGFYRAASGKVIGANRAYLTTTSASEARALTIVFGGNITGIEEVQEVQEVLGQAKRSPSDVRLQEFKDSEYYDLSGRRVANPTKGIYIKDGKKYIFN